MGVVGVGGGIGGGVIYESDRGENREKKREKRGEIGKRGRSGC
jgi:hypothetical protein